MSSFIGSGTQSTQEIYGRYLTWANHYYRIPREIQPPADTPNGYNPPSQIPETIGGIGFVLPPNLGGISSPEIGMPEYNPGSLERLKPSEMLGIESDKLADLIESGISENDFTELDAETSSADAAYSQPWQKYGPSNNFTLYRTIAYGFNHLMYQSSGWYYDNFFGGIFFGGASYCDLYDLWIWQITKKQTISFSRWSCPQGEPNLTSQQEEIGERCAPPNPDLGSGGGGSGDTGNGGGGVLTSTRKKRTAKRILRTEEEMGCCSCAAIADMLAQQTFNIKEMFDRQNMEIGETLGSQTQFLQNQIIAAIPEGFDYEPIFRKIDDARNDIWNGLNK